MLFFNVTNIWLVIYDCKVVLFFFIILLTLLVYTYLPEPSALMYHYFHMWLSLRVDHVLWMKYVCQQFSVTCSGLILSRNSFDLWSVYKCSCVLLDKLNLRSNTVGRAVPAVLKSLLTVTLDLDELIRREEWKSLASPSTPQPPRSQSGPPAFTKEKGERSGPNPALCFLS